MSLINKMLKELDKRHAPAPAVVPPTVTGPAPIPARPGSGLRVGSELFWWLMAALMVVAIAWMGWVIWQLTPRSVVNDGVFRPFAGATARTVDEPMPVQPVLEPQAAEASGAAAPSVPPAPSQQAAALPSASFNMLKLATEISTPIPSRPRTPEKSPAEAARAAEPPARGREEARLAEARGRPVGPAAKAAAPGGGIAQAPVSPLVASPLGAAPAKPAATAADSRIDKRVPAGPHERAEAEYRRGVTLVNQGRVSEGMDALRSALAAEAAHEPARQTLVALLVEQRRLDDAVVVLEEGLSLRPGNVDAAMLLARVLVDRHDNAGALAVLQKYAPAANQRADYHGFAAALLQRLGRHKEAIDEYQAALRLAPQTGAWWVGMGISQEAAERRKEALESFRRAKASGIGGELLAYVDQRLRQLQ